MLNYLKYAVGTVALSLAAISPMHAQTDTPIIEFHTQIYEMFGADHSFHIVLGAVDKERTYVDIDFGFGPTEYQIEVADYSSEDGGIKGTSISGKVSSEGIVRVYGDPLSIDYFDMEGIYADRVDISRLVNLDVFNACHNYLEELDLTPNKKLEAVYVDDNPFDKKPFLLGDEHPNLAILSMHNIGSLDQSFSLTHYPKLLSFDANNTYDLRVCDPTKNPELLQLSIGCTNVETIDVSQNPKLIILSIDQARITDIDLSNNLELQQLYADHYGILNEEYKLKKLDLTNLEKLQILMVSGNELTDLDISNCPLIWELSAAHNLLPGIDFSGNPDLYNVNISNNLMDFVTIPEVRETFGEYYYWQEPFAFDRSYPVGAEIDLRSRLNRPGSETTAQLLLNGEDIGGNYYSYDEGIIRFKQAIPDSVSFSFRNSAFEDYGLTTTQFVVKEVSDFGKDVAMVTWRLRPTTKDVRLSVGIAGATPENPKRFSVDFGDGNPVDYYTSTNLLTEQPIVTTDKKNIGSMVLYIPEGEDLTAFSINDTPLISIDVTAAHSLSYLTVDNCGISEIDLKNNDKLRMLNLNNNALTSLDLRGTNNSSEKTVLKRIYANNNKISEYFRVPTNNTVELELANNEMAEFDFSKINTMEYLNLSGNLLTSVNLQDAEALTYLNLSDNELKDLFIPDYTPLTDLDISNNRFPMSTLPEPGIVANYIYAPQKMWMLPDKAPTVDLSSQLVTVDGHSTEINWYTVEGNRQLNSTEISGTGGKFKFLQPLVGTDVYASWSNEAFPDFSGENIYRSQNMQAAEVPTHVVASFTTTEADEASLIMRSVTPNNFVYIDWAGDGDLSQYALNHLTYVIYPIVTYKNADVKVYSYDDQDGISVFTLSDVPLSKIDLSSMTDVHSINISNAGLSTDQIILPSHNLESLNLSGNQIKGLDISKYTNLKSLTLSECGLTEFDASPYKSLENLVLDGNKFKTVTLNNPKLWNTFINGCELEEIDLSNVPNMTQLYLFNNNLTHLDVSMLQNLKVLHISSNKFTLTTLPRVLSTYVDYVYSNQALYPVTVEDGCRIDLSSQLMVGTNRTNYRWFRDRNVGYLEDGTIAGDELKEGEEYTANDGVFTFSVGVKDAVCVMTNIAFPNLVFLSNPTDIKGSGVEEVIDGTTLFSVASADGMIGVIGAEGTVALYTLDGQLVNKVEAKNGISRFDGLASGIYIVTNGKHTAKVLVK